MQIYEVTSAKWVKDYLLEITFSNSRKARLNLKKFLGQGVFKELLEIKKFKQFKVDTELGTIVWSNGADIAPEVLYEEAVRNTSLPLSDAA